MSPHAKRWTAKEIEILSNNRGKSIEDLKKIFPNRTDFSLQVKMGQVFSHSIIMENKEEIISLYTTGKRGISFISKKFGINPSTLKSYLSEFGVLKAPDWRAVTGHNIRGSNNFNWTGYGDLSGGRFNNIKRDAVRRDIEFKVDIQYLWNLFLSQDKICPLSGEKLVMSTNSKLRTASLDRIDYLVGYIEGNLQWVHKKVNVMKNSMPDDDFVSWCKKIVEYSQHAKGLLLEEAQATAGSP